MKLYFDPALTTSLIASFFATEVHIKGTLKDQSFASIH
jgi:hypothetical protein